MTFLNRVASALRLEGVDYAIAGGYAVALHGVVRGTLDVDIVLRHDREEFLRAEKALTLMGLAPKLPVTAGQVFDFRKEYIEQRNLIAWSFVNPSNPGELVDILITHDLAKLGTKRIVMGGEAILVVTKRDLIAMKRASGRPQDLEDIKALESL